MKKKFTKKAKKAPVKKAVKNKTSKPISKKALVKNQGKPIPKRDKKGRLMKGHSGNPAGRPKGTYKYGEWYQEKLNSKEIDISVTITQDGKSDKQHFKYSADKSFRELLFVKLFQKALDGEIMAIRELLDRSEGRPTQPLAGALGLESGRSYEELLKDVQSRNTKLLPFRTGTDRT